MNHAFLLTGGNTGNRLLSLKQATDELGKKTGKIVKVSSIYETAAWGFTEQPAFLNQVLLISTALSAPQLLQTILQAELQLGRKRVQKMGPRNIDIDILFYNHDIVSAPGLMIPHPRIAERRFVLTPLYEIAPGFVHPALKKTIEELLQECKDELEVKKYTGF